MIALVVTYHCKPGQRETLKEKIFAEKIDQASAAENGNLRYEYADSLSSADDLIILEKWADADCLAAHGTQAHYKRLGELKAQYVDGVVIEKYFSE